MKTLLSLEDFGAAARKSLPRPIYAYLTGGSETQSSLAENRSVFGRFEFVTRVLRDVSRRSTKKTLMGARYASPFGIAPMGISALFAYRGDVVLAKAALAGSIPMIISGASLVPVEEIVAQNPDCWFQAYLGGEPDEVERAIQRIETAGVSTLVLTVDVPTASNREEETRAGFTSPLKPSLRLAWDFLVRPRWLIGVFARTVLAHGMPAFENVGSTARIPVISASAARDLGKRGALNWDHVARIRRRWTGRLIIKGVLHPEDARQARRLGADGVIVSNHGGRQLDGAVSPLVMLPEIVAAADGMAVMVDSGFRRGTDVIKALALGADFVFIGRPFAYAAAVGGIRGVTQAIDLLRCEIDRDLAMLGYTSVEDVDCTCLRNPPALISGSVAASIAS